MSSNEYFTPPTALAPGTKARSADVNAISQAVDSAFDRLPGALAINTGTTTYAQAAGTGNAYTATLSTLITTYRDGMEVKLLPMRANTGPATLNVNGIGNIPIKRHDGTDPEASDLMATSPVVLIYVAATNSFRMPPVADGQVAAAAASATAAAQSAGSAAQSSTNASQAAGSASGQATAAAGSASAAAGSATAAAGSATAANTSATNAQTYMQAAQTAAAQASSGQGAGAVYALKDADGQVQLGGDGNGSIEIGRMGRGSSGTPFLDFHSSAGSGDYDVRMIASGGSGSGIGQGLLNILGGTLRFNGSDIVTSGSIGSLVAGSAVKLQTARSINGVSFNGTSDITINTAPSGLNVTNGTDLYLKSAAGSSDIGDIVFADSAGAEKHRIWDNVAGTLSYRYSSGPAYNLLHSGNYNSYAPGLTGAGATGSWSINISGSASTAGNTSSVSSATGNNYTWTGTQIFQRNSGAASTHATVTDFALIPNSTDGGAAGISFVRGGQFAVNMALDPDNVIRIGGYSGPAARFQFDCNTGANSGNFTAAGNISATSDERLKDDWQAVDDDFVARWAQVRAGTYRRIDTGAIQVGLGAQSVQRILPQAVLTDKNDFLSLNYGGAAAVATVALAREAVAMRAEIQKLTDILKKAGLA